MRTKAPKATDRKPRVDAQRNRERILGVAKREFTRLGANASLEELAKKAGVGPGTLYRHFPTRENLLVAVYRSEMEKLAAAERNLADTVSPVEALRAWLLLFVDAVETKRIIAPVLNTLVGDPKKVFEVSYVQIHEALRALVRRAIKNGDMRKDLDPIDLLRAIVGVSNVSASPDWRQSAKRLVDILITGARPRSSRRSPSRIRSR
jgi:AcrR family transcriptional regulator